MKEDCNKDIADSLEQDFKNIIEWLRTEPDESLYTAELYKFCPKSEFESKLKDVALANLKNLCDNLNAVFS